MIRSLVRDVGEFKLLSDVYRGAMSKTEKGQAQIKSQQRQMYIDFLEKCEALGIIDEFDTYQLDRMINAGKL